MTRNTIMHGNWLKWAETLPNNCADCCVTDGPYGLKFMGKKWDCQVPSVEIWQQVLRVLKPGGHLLNACGTRTYHRAAVNIEDAGFEIRDVICWHYGEGFPKSMDISKAIDKEAGAERTILSEGKAVKRMIPGADQDKTGSWIKDNGRTFIPTETEPATEGARQWDGWGTALKPATELWTLARKPLEKNTVAANVLAHGTGGLNIDASRIGEEVTGWGGKGSKGFMGGLESNERGGRPVTGRFPANLILDDFMAEEMNKQSGELSSGGRKPEHGNAEKTKNIYGKFKMANVNTFEANSGGASRFFYVAKPSPEERAGSTHVTIKPQTLIQYFIKLICPIEPGRIMLDPFAGSGAHCIAARKLGLDFYACELNEVSCGEANERVTKAMGLFI